MSNTPLEQNGIDLDEVLEKVNALPQAGIVPEGNIDITDINEVDVAEYATAKVVEDNLIPANIKKGVSILRVVGELEEGINPVGSITLTEENTYDVTEKAEAVVDMSETRAGLAEVVTSKGVETPIDSDFDTIKQNIERIECGGSVGGMYNIRVVENKDGTQSFDITDAEGGGITPLGNKEIYSTDIIDVSEYATAQVVDDNLVSENIKAGVTILGKTGSLNSAPSAVGKMDGGSFTIANDVLCGDYSIHHTLGVIPRGFFIWVENGLTKFETGNHLYTVFCAFNYYTAASTSSATSYGYVSILARHTNGSYYQLNNDITNINNLQTAATTVDLHCIRANQYYKAGCTYKWLAWA